MSENKESYWSKHHTGLIQCALGAYCAAFATWTYFHPRAEATAAPVGGAKQVSTLGYSMPFWLWVGIIALVLSVVIPAILKMLASRKRLPVVAVEDPQPWELQGITQQQWTDQMAEENRCTALGRSLGGMFNESQVDALRLRRDLQQFLASETERAKSKLTGSDFDKKQMWKLVWHNRDSELTARYKLEMKAWTEMVYNQLILSGAHNERFEWLAENACTHEQIYEMTNLLWEMVGEVGRYRDDKN